MKDIIGTYIINDSILKEADCVTAAVDKNEMTVYEVIRIIDGIPLYYEDHFERLNSSLEAYNLASPVSLNALKKDIFYLMDANGLTNCNVRVLVYKHEGEIHYTIYNVKSVYPKEDAYINGVPVDVMHWERSDPNIKYLNNYYKEKSTRLINEKEVFELLLINKDGLITEGSKSNVFFVKRNKVITPSDKYVLRGVTRKYILQACEYLGIEVDEELISVDELSEIDGLFLSGTSIKVLPVSRVGDISYNSSINEVILKIKNRFDLNMEKYLNKNLK